MSTSKITKFRVQAQLTEGDTWASFDRVLSSYKEAQAHLQYLISMRPDIHIWRITRESITTSFAAYQPIFITSPATT